MVCLNAHAVYDQLLLQESIKGQKYTHTEFKRIIAEQFCKGTDAVVDTTPTSLEVTNDTTTVPTPLLIVDIDVPFHKHHMSQIEGNFRPSCYVCTMYNCQHNIRKSKPRVNMMCLICKIAFHPTCFLAYHNPDTVTNMDVRGFLGRINPPKKARQITTSICDIKVAPLPFLKRD